ncbi:hypothetical protein [Roseomonas sp. 18066]|uniref:hypothetical protein n=1 Tax=Roseomonas sp. 18066 TaxID=2681412 RepID=UPI00135AD612|nr:hypothetical protein [Roseomonas sp. 18066]
MEMDEALRRGAARLDRQSGRLLSRARALAGPGQRVVAAAGQGDAGTPAPADLAASRAALGASHVLLSEAIALLAPPR